MRRFLAFLMALSVILTLCACSGSDTEKRRKCGLYVTVEATDVYTVSFGTESGSESCTPAKGDAFKSGEVVHFDPAGTHAEKKASYVIDYTVCVYDKDMEILAVASFSDDFGNMAKSISTYTPETMEAGSTGLRMDERAVSSLEKLLDAAKDAGYTPYVGTAYVSYSQQQKQFNAKATELSEDADYSYDEAVELARQIVAYPGCSEHQTGLAVDIFDQKYSVYDYSKMNAEFYKWLVANCAEYGFIKRYPSDKAELTGWDEPWHYRYVGKEAAKFIMENDLCFEEFCAHYR